MDVSRACNRQGSAGILPGPLGRHTVAAGAPPASGTMEWGITRSHSELGS